MAAHGTPPVTATTAHTEVDGGPVHHDDHGPYLLGFNAEGWVYVGLTIFFLIAIFVAKAPRKILDALDARIVEARKELDRAYAIRQEAEALLAEAHKRNAASAGDAAAIVAQAETEAAALVAKAEADAADLVKRRTKMAQDKIAAAERSAVAEVRAKAAEAAAKAATSLIAESHGASADKALVDGTISGLASVN
jgi:F-type H+-transporting ATPase subunit b